MTSNQLCRDKWSLEKRFLLRRKGKHCSQVSALDSGSLFVKVIRNNANSHIFSWKEKGYEERSLKCVIITYVPLRKHSNRTPDFSLVKTYFISNIFTQTYITYKHKLHDIQCWKRIRFESIQCLKRSFPNIKFITVNLAVTILELTMAQYHLILQC
jgi:hypothetical protein